MVAESRVRVWRGKHASIVFDPDMYPRVEVLGRNVYRLLSVDLDVLMLGRVVCCTGGDAQDILLVGRHPGGRKMESLQMSTEGYKYKTVMSGVLKPKPDCGVLNGLRCRRVCYLPAREIC